MTSDHFVQFYDTDSSLVHTVGNFIGAGLLDGGAGIVIASPLHREGIDQRLADIGINVAAERASGRYTSLDASATLARITVDGEIDSDSFEKVIGDVVERVRILDRPLRVFGEMVALLALDGCDREAIRLEQMWSEFQTRHRLSLCCAYPIDRLGGVSRVQFFEEICDAHMRVLPAASFSALTDADDRQRAVTALQQRALSLEIEVRERARAEERLRSSLIAEQDARAATEAALRLRDEFLSIAAHELKTPITSLLAVVQLAIRRLERSRQENHERDFEVLQTILSQTRRLHRLVNQLLDISRLEAGQLGLDAEKTDLVALVNQAVAAARLSSEQHPIQFDAPPPLEAVVDPLRLEQVLTNLLDNATKYSPGGGQIDVSLHQTADGWIDLAVRDRGVGVPAESRERIFDRFFQAHDGDQKTGWGLGLSICKEIIDLHHGRIQVEFPEDGGTRFRVNFPTTPDKSGATHEVTSAKS